MTKIDEIHPGAAQPQPKAPAAKPGGGGFAKLLEEALAPEAPPRQAAQPAGPPPAPGAEAVRPAAEAQGLAPAQAETLARAERTLESLELYSRLLGDRGVPLKEVEPALRQAQAEARGLAQAAEGLEPADELRRFADQALALVTAQSLKFQRGDYL
jgi:hypothetical protein